MRTKYFAVGAILLMMVSTTLQAAGKTPVVPDVYMLLIRDPYVHQLIQADVGQVRAIQAVTDKVDGQFWPLRNYAPGQAGGKLTKLIDQTRMKINGILRPLQHQRVEQILLRTQGLKGLLRKDVVLKLGLTGNQQGQVQTALVQLDKDLADVNKQLRAGKPKGPLQVKSRQLQQKAQRKLVALLTGNQKTKFGRLLGEQVDLARLFKNLRFKAPEFIQGNSWIGSKPLTMRSLRGKVIALHFYAFG